MKIILSGTLKRLHVDKHILAANRKTGATAAPLTIQTSIGSHKASSVKILGKSEFIYRPDKPLSCGAVAWIETRARLEYEDAP